MEINLNKIRRHSKIELSYFFFKAKPHNKANFIYIITFQPMNYYKFLIFFFLKECLH